MGSMSDLKDVPPRRIWEGVQARVINGERMTLATVEISPGQQVPEHTHDNEQMGFVIQGSVTFTIGGDIRTLGPGGSWKIHSNVAHQVAAGPEGAVVAECYAPLRADWASLSTRDPPPPVWPVS